MVLSLENGVEWTCRKLAKPVKDANLYQSAAAMANFSFSNQRLIR